jgi:hypothetical protein
MQTNHSETRQPLVTSQHLLQTVYSTAKHDGGLPVDPSHRTYTFRSAQRRLAHATGSNANNTIHNPSPANTHPPPA